MPFRTKEEKRIYDQARYRTNAEQINLRHKAYYQANAERLKDYHKAYYQANIEELKVQQKLYRQANGKTIKVRKKAYSHANRHRINEWQKGYLKTNPDRKLAHYYRKRLCEKLKDQNARKSQKSIPLLGCDMQWLVAWLEVQFRPGMTWENYGPVWHVDHIRPCAAFDLEDPIQQKLCFHWTNLQPLFAQENISKGSKWEISQEAA